jgi:H+-transporting ATPase
LFCVGSLVIGKFELGLGTGALQTLVVVTLVFSGQAVFYVSRERRHLWSSKPGRWLIVSSVVDLTIIILLASNGVLMTALPIIIVGGVITMAIALAMILDYVKFALFQRLTIA